MPIYEQTYREYTGDYRQRFRWLIIIQQELRILIKSKFFLIMALGSMLHFLLRLMQVTIFDIVAQDPNSAFAVPFKGIQELEVNGNMFFEFLRMQAAVVFIVTIFSGAGMICNDIKNNLMEIYFSKPITWLDYALGKILALAFIASVHSLIPALVLVGLHNLMLPSMDTFKDSMGWMVGIFGYSASIIAPCILGVLASSAMIKSKNFASAAILMLLFANSAMGGTLGGVLSNENYLAVSFPIAIDHIGLNLFNINRQIMPNLNWGWCAAYVVAVCVVSLVIILRRIRRAEVAQ
jgi:ABC-type transport system involved in multi-copper enzyme maturation permease subunit